MLFFGRRLQFLFSWAPLQTSWVSSSHGGMASLMQPSSEQGRSHNIFSGVASEVTNHFYNIPLVAQVIPSLCVKGIHQSVNTRRQGSLGVIFRLATILSKGFFISDIVLFIFSISSWFIFIASISLLNSPSLHAYCLPFPLRSFNILIIGIFKVPVH